MVLLHGVLDVHIKEAQDLPHSLINQAGGLVKKVLCCSAGPQLAGSCDPYLCLDVGKTRRLRSAIITSTTNPKWDERASVYLADEADTLKIEIKVDHSSGHIHEAVSAVDRRAALSCCCTQHSNLHCKHHFGYFAVDCAIPSVGMMMRLCRCWSGLAESPAGPADDGWPSVHLPRQKHGLMT
jgi:hypothetical protein